MAVADGVVEQRAIRHVQGAGGNVEDQLAVLGEHVLQFGIFKGQTFQWALSNALGYAGVALFLYSGSHTGLYPNNNGFRLPRCQRV